MSGDFIDSNVFIYLFDKDDPIKSQIATELIDEAVRDGTASVSFQVVQETLNVITRKLAVPITTEDARDFLEKVLMPLWRVMPSHALYDRALVIQARYQYSFYDALIIAAAVDASCSRLYSEDLQNGQKIEGLIVTNPFAN